MKTSAFFSLVGLSVILPSCFPVPVDMPMPMSPPQQIFDNGGYYQGGGGYYQGGHNNYYQGSSEPWNRYHYNPGQNYGYGGRFSGQNFFDHRDRTRDGPQSRAQWGP